MGTGINGALIDLRDVVKTYKTGAGSLTVLKEVTLKVYPSEFISIVGPSGSGKSTLLNMITGIDKPTKGQVFVGGEAVHRLSENKLASWRGRHIGVVFQFFQLLPTLTVLENVMLPMDFCHLYHGHEREQRALSLLDQVGIAAQAHKLPIFYLVVIAILLLAACTTVAPSSSPTMSPTIVPATASRAPTAVPPTVSPSPTPKPNVLRVVYSKGGHVTLWTEGKGARQLAEANLEQVRISDDGQVIAYLGYSSAGNAGPYGIFAINAEGANQRRLVGQDYVRNIPSAERIVSFDFAPASHTLYFVTDQYDLHRVNTDSGAPAPVFESGRGGFFSFSPDGQWMTLYHPNQLVLTHLDGSDAHVVFQYPEDFGYTIVGPEIIWEPDSSGFHTTSASGPQGSADSMTVWFVPVVGDPVKQMSYAGPYGANLSPDGRKVVYLYSQHEPIDVHVVAQDGKDTTYNSYSSKSYVNLQFMGWAPDSKHFLLNLSKDGRLHVPYLCAVGEQPVKLTDTDDAHAIVWVDAQRVLFVRRGVTLHLQRVGEPSILLDANASSWFDTTYVNP